MPDRHKTKPLSLRLPEALSAWVAEEAARTGKPVRRVILDAIEGTAAERERIAKLAEEVGATYWVGPDNSPAPRRPFALLLKKGPLNPLPSPPATAGASPCPGPRI